MTGSQAADLLSEIANLMILKGENPFKIRAFEKAVDVVKDREDLGERAKAGTLTELAGIGKGIAEVLTDFAQHGKSKIKAEIEASLPAGLLELTQIPGLGPKRAMQLIEELEIHSVRELEYACKENRLLKLKGFGIKAQDKILQGIQFLNSTQGQQRISEAFPFAEKALAALTEAVNPQRVSETGALRRRMETLSELEFLIECPSKSEKEFERKAKSVVEKFAKANPGSLPVELKFAPTTRYGYELAKTTGTEAHWKALGAPAPFEAPTEEDFFEKLDLTPIPPEMRETGAEVEIARKQRLGEILPWGGIRGVFHNHTTRSDGSATLEQMVVAAKKLGYHYIGISDHSQSAFYAQGLKPSDLKDQEKEIRQIQEKHPEIRVFWGIESDILADGSLDYDEAQLKRFDFVIGSIHSRFKMEREAMTDRILSAIRHPCLRFVGHVTGRLLLGRKGYDIDMERIIKEAAKYDVAIEINAHPARLDIDWRWGEQLRKCGTRVSVNPDAHDTEGLEDVKYGIAVARKALLPSKLVVNAGSVQEVERWLKRG